MTWHPDFFTVAGRSTYKPFAFEAQAERNVATSGEHSKEGDELNHP